MERTVTILIDGKKIPLNPFSQEIVGNVVSALAGSFKKVDPQGTIEIRIDKAPAP